MTSKTDQANVELLKEQWRKWAYINFSPRQIIFVSIKYGNYST